MAKKISLSLKEISGIVSVIDPIDYDLVTKEASHIGQEALEMWNQVLAKANDEVAGHKR